MTPLTGATGTLSSNADGTVVTATGAKLVDNTFSVPAASGCGYLLLDRLIITAGVNLKDIEVLAIREDGGAIRLGLESPEDVRRAGEILGAAGFEVRARG